MTPLQAKILARAAAAAIVAAICFAGGWTVNGWRLDGKLERLQGDLDAATTQAEIAAKGLEACNAGVDAARRQGDAAIAQGKAMLAEARRLAAGGREQAARVEALLEKPTPAGAGCDQAWAEIARQRTAGAAK